MKFLNLDHLESEKAGSLSGGQKKLLELGRTMMVDARKEIAKHENKKIHLFLFVKVVSEKKL